MQKITHSAPTSGSVGDDAQDRNVGAPSRTRVPQSLPSKIEVSSPPHHVDADQGEHAPWPGRGRNSPHTRSAAGREPAREAVEDPPPPPWTLVDDVLVKQAGAQRKSVDDHIARPVDQEPVDEAGVETEEPARGGPEAADHRRAEFVHVVLVFQHPVDAREARHHRVLALDAAPVPDPPAEPDAEAGRRDRGDDQHQLERQRVLLGVPQAPGPPTSTLRSRRSK